MNPLAFRADRVQHALFLKTSDTFVICGRGDRVDPYARKHCNSASRGRVILPLLSLLMASGCISAYAADTVSKKNHARPAHGGAAGKKITPARDEVIGVQVARFRPHGAETSVTRHVMDRFVAGTSPMRILSATTPGVTFASDDAFGLDTLANTLYVRGFNQSQIGATLDGIPMGDQGFLQYNGLNIDQAEIQENISGMELSQGGGALTVPSTQNLGGALQFYSSDPTDKFGGKVSQLFGSNNSVRTFVRIDSGALNSTGTKLFVSMARTNNDKWKGYGNQFEQQVNSKLVQPIASLGKITALFNWSQFRQFNYLGMSMNMFRKLGPNLDYLYPDYSAAYNAALGNYPKAYDVLGNESDLQNATYLDGAQSQQNYLMAVIADFQLTPRLDEKTIIYAHLSDSDIEATEDFPSPNGAPLVQADGPTSLRRLGFVESLDYHIAGNTIQTGVWYENNAYSYPTYFYQQPLLGEGPPRNPLGPFRNPFTEELNDQFNTNTFQYYLQDTYAIRHDLRVSAGFKSFIQTTHGGAKSNNSFFTGETELPSGTLTASSAFLPHFSINYKPDSHNEIYVDISENMRAYSYSPWFVANGGAWAVQNQQQFVNNKNSIKPERVWDYVLGYRYTSKHFDMTADIYHADYYDRLLNTTAGLIVQPISTIVNAGRESIYGADVSATIRPFDGLEIFNSVSYNDSEYKQGIMYESAYVQLNGKKQVAYPSWIYKTNASYSYRKFRATFNATYTDRRPLSYVNDVFVPAYWLAGVSAGYEFGRIGVLRHLRADLGVTNLFGSKYIGGMGFSGFPVTGDYPTLFAGAPRQFFGTLSAKFR
ncbi:TonB-dependent receptor domain-containing protein [Acidomonas methanolica]|nr:TonB-dependent receptor [Acidomonas methanolica]GBQ56734.1 TonB-dependent receptor [Acidomonas methanolica]